MKIVNATVYLNRIPTNYNLQADFEVARQYHLKHGVSWNFTFKSVDVKGYTSVSMQIPLAGQRWLIQNSQNFITLDPNTDVNIFCFDEAEWATPIGSQFPLLPNTPTGCTYLVNNKPFINIATYISDHTQGITSVEIAHEGVHALTFLAKLAGFNIIDQLDTYFENNLQDLPNSNFMIQWKLLANFLSMETYKYFNPTTDPLMVGVSPTLMHIADTARGIAGVPFIITSGLRTPQQNTQAGGVSNSAHLTGLALDIAVTDATRQAILKSLLTCGSLLFIEDCPDHIHFDINSNIHTLGWAMVAQNG